MISGEPVSKPEDGGAMALHQNAEGIPITRERALDGNGVGCPDALNAFVHSYP
jgi:hypothetical protein